MQAYMTEIIADLNYDKVTHAPHHKYMNVGDYFETIGSIDD